MHELTQQIFKNRGYGDDILFIIGDESKNSIPHTDKFTEFLREIYLKKERIVLIPDFDTDGIMSGITGFSALCELGFKVSIHTPHPSEGYGFSPSTVDKIMTLYPDVKCLLTSDNGITCYKGIDYAKDKGLKVIVTDHHLPGDGINNADVIIDPHLPESLYEYPDISGTYVLFLSLYAYALKYADGEKVENIERLKVFSGIGSLADSMPVTRDGRRLTQDCLSIMRYLTDDFDFGGKFPEKFNANGFLPKKAHPVYMNVFKGLYTFLYLLYERGKIRYDFSADTVLFYMAPVFNSIKRMNESTEDIFKIFFLNNFKKIRKYCEKAFDLNDERKKMVEDFMERTLSRDNPYAPYIYITDAGPGITGLLAQRFMEKNGGFPCVFIRKNPDESYSGTGRNPEFYNYHEEVKPYALCQGHKGAFGIFIDSPDNLEKLYLHLSSTVPFQMDKALSESVLPFYDYTIDFKEKLTDENYFFEYLREKEELEPFGKGFEKPFGHLKIPFSVLNKDSFIPMKDIHIKVSVKERGFSCLLFFHTMKIIESLGNFLKHDLPYKVKMPDDMTPYDVYMIPGSGFYEDRDGEFVLFPPGDIYMRSSDALDYYIDLLYDGYEKGVFDLSEVFLNCEGDFSLNYYNGVYSVDFKGTGDIVWDV